MNPRWFNLASIKWYLGGVLVLSAAAIAVATFKDHALMEAYFSHMTYYVFMVLAVLWVSSLIRVARETGFRPAAARPYAVGILMACVLSAVVFISVKSSFRVLSDETNLLSVSRTMTFERRVDNVTEGLYYYGNFNPTTRTTEIHPLIYCFFLHLFHTLTGYRAENAFVFNTLVLGVILALFYAFAGKRFGKIWGLLGGVLIVAHPIISINAVSSSLDIFNTLFVLISFGCLSIFLQKPSAASFTLLWFSLFITAYARYESAIFFAITMLSLAVLKKIKLEYFSNPLPFALTPLLGFPLVWQRILKASYSEYPGGSIVTAFTTKFFVDHNIAFFKGLVNFKFFLPYANAVNAVGVIAILWFAGLYLTNRLRLSDADRSLIRVTLTNLAVLWVVVTAYFFGTPDHPTSARFFMMSSIVLSFFALMLFRNVISALKVHPLPAGVIVLVPLFLYHPIAIEDRFTNTLTMIREQRFIAEYLKKLPDRNFLLVAPAPNQFIVYSYGAISTYEANAQGEGLLDQYRNRLYSNIFVVQYIRYVDKLPTQETALDAMFELKTLVELQNTPEVFIRISQLVNSREIVSPEETPDKPG